MGSATVAKALLANDLVDELDLMIEPIVLGGGKSIFSADGIARRFRLESVTQANTGVLCCRYLPVSDALRPRRARGRGGSGPDVAGARADDRGCRPPARGCARTSR